jgi:hypothetical protein
MFRRIVKSSFLFIRRAVVVFCKGFFLTITGFRRLKVEIICVNDVFLLSNGLLAIHWRAKNVVWVSIQRKWIGSRDSGVVVFSARGTRVLAVRVQGLLSSYKRKFIVPSLTSVGVREPSLAYPKVIVKADQLCPIFLPGAYQFDALTNWSFRAVIPPVEITVPIFQNEINNDKRLLP